MKDECKGCEEAKKSLDRLLQRLDQTIIKANRLLHDHPDAITLTEAYENMPVQINLNDPSLPVVKNKWTLFFRAGVQNLVHL